MKQVNKTPSSTVGFLEYAMVLGLIILAAILSLIFLSNNIYNLLPPALQSSPAAPASPLASLVEIPRDGFISFISVPAASLLVSLKGQ
jgi:hypothetical protein